MLGYASTRTAAEQTTRRDEMAFKKSHIPLFIGLVFVCLSGCSPAGTTKKRITAQEIIAQEDASEWDLVVLGDSDMWLSY